MILFAHLSRPPFVAALPLLLAACGVHGELDVGVTTTTTTTDGETVSPSPIVGLSAAAATACALRSSGEVVCWGRPFGAPVQVAFPEAEELSVGASRICVRTPTGGVVCRALPLTSDGALGEPVAVPGLEDAEQISAGASHVCALREGGLPVCWGDNSFGQLGNGTFDASELPSPVGIGPVTAVSAGEFHTCALTGAGVFCWGRSFAGQLGQGLSTELTLCPNGTESCVPSPVMALSLLEPSRVSAGLNGACAIHGPGSTVFCWGWHSSPSGAGDSPMPVIVPGVGEATEVFAGYTLACAVLPGGRVRCWGDNANGALGDGTLQDPSAAVDVLDLDDVTAVTGGWYFTCALRGDGEVLCWGGNSFGELGSDVEGPVLTPTRVDL